jgi:hypothetical protein
VNAALQMLGVAAIAIGFAGTWLAAHRPTGWLVCLTSAGLWIVSLGEGQQWTGVANCCISMAICVRNYRSSRRVRVAISTTIRQPAFQLAVPVEDESATLHQQRVPVGIG